MTTTRRAATIEQDNRNTRDLVLWMTAKVEALERKLAEKQAREHEPPHA
jgi:uncharacterized coiled-coil protein SlyX